MDLSFSLRKVFKALGFLRGCKKIKIQRKRLAAWEFPLEGAGNAGGSRAGMCRLTACV